MQKDQNPLLSDAFLDEIIKEINQTGGGSRSGQEDEFENDSE